jgi:glycosyltransferase involved in cell wall biosynthesis
VVQVHQQVNSGIAGARNTGIGLASAPWLAFLDADDLWTRDSLRVRLEAFTRSPETDLVFGQLEQFHSPEMDTAARARLPIEVSPADARFAGTMLARRDSFLRAGFFNTALKIGEMIDWIARADSAGLRTQQVNQVVMRRRVHGDNTTLRQAVDRSAYLRALKVALDQRRTPRSA